ncbi:Amino acid/polyamine transporter I [Penicillium chermesinum]|uniref:Amino acid/polyamine transporter I n=1 Tax=Penicillium chermesinum TaxID=63820 RepID=A0A9W9NR53_9EURO|nr:Amino acid/polyamine transporter I [Penicillium chermesinum]KAJ5223403.1 Amino acid/polyamine transporter I [Penicillium chermesinum]
MMISFSFVGLTIYLVLLALGEVAAWSPKPSTLADQANRYCDPALGFSLAWIYWLKYAIVTPNQLTAATLLIGFWVDAERINPGVWITVFLAVITGINFLHQALPGRLEFYIASFKLLVMSALMILSIVIALGGGPDHDRRGFRYWQSPYDAFGTFGAGNDKLVDRFFVVCNTMSSATFAFVGSERSGILIRAPDVRKAMSRAIKHTFYRVLVSHLLAITLLGMLIPPYSEHLAFNSHSEKRAAASPFVAAIYLSGIKVVPHILNACILVFVLSIGNFDLFLATKALCDLALKHRAPAVLARTNSRGIPIYSLLLCVLISMLAYINVSKNSTVVFGYFVNLVTMLGLLTWVSVLVTHMAFVRARRAQGVPDKSLGDHIRFDPLAIVSSYIAVPLYLVLIIGYKFAVRCKGVDPMRADLWTDRLDINVAVSVENRAE